MALSAVPTVDMRCYASDRETFVAELGAAYREFGFCCIRGHGIPAQLISNGYAVFQRFFALPQPLKMRYHRVDGGGARGYTPFKVETARDSEYADLKEFWHIGREIDRRHRYAAAMPANLWPEEIPGFHEYGYALYTALDELGVRVLRALALHMGLSEHFFDDKVDTGNSILRPIHYPPIEDLKVRNVRAGAHEDINLITLLVGASAAGLEVLTRQGTWLPITAAEGVIVVNIGDMLQRLTNHVYPSTTHRVVNPSAGDAYQSRYSVPFFLHPNPDFLIDVLPACIDAEHPNRYPQAITAQTYLQQRLHEIRLI